MGLSANGGRAMVDGVIYARALPMRALRRSLCMDFYYIMRSVLFEGLDRSQVEALFGCLKPELRHYSRGEAYAAGAPTEPLLIDIVADKDSEILMFDVERFMTPCMMGCERHRKAQYNFTRLLALRNIELSRRTFVTAPRTIREKVQSYLSFQAARHGSSSFDITVNREQMAAYLGVDRSALSAELSRMKAEGLIDYHMRHFTIFENAKVDNR